jgi:hypothetical protein
MGLYYASSMNGNETAEATLGEGLEGAPARHRGSLAIRQHSLVSSCRLCYLLYHLFQLIH